MTGNDTHPCHPLPFLAPQSKAEVGVISRTCLQPCLTEPAANNVGGCCTQQTRERTESEKLRSPPPGLPNRRVQHSAITQGYTFAGRGNIVEDKDGTGLEKVGLKGEISLHLD